MKEFEVRLTVSEFYTTYVFAEDEEQAREIAVDMLNSDELEVHHNSMEHEVEATGYEED